MSYWGVFLALTDSQKYKICEDLLRPSSWPITDIDGGDKVSFPLSVAALKVEKQRMELGPVLTFLCRGIDRNKNTFDYVISHGYLRNTFFLSIKPRRNALVRSFVIGTAAYVIQPLSDLEQFYYDIRFQIGKSSEKYIVQLVCFENSIL